MNLPARTAELGYTSFGQDVLEGLGALPKKLPPRYFYDAVGSALFDAITLLPEYGLTRADERVLVRAAPALAARLGEVGGVVELGSGSGRKTKPVLEAFASGQRALRYVAIDGSGTALGRCRLELADVPGLAFEGLEAGYLDGVQRVLSVHAGRPVLVLFLGGSVGNFERDEAVEFLRGLRSYLRAGDGLLIGTDLEEDADRLVLAYDDPAGVTAAFNLNLLARINRELDGEFDLQLFRHEARWSAEERRVEMHLRSLADQEVWVGALGRRFTFRRGETIWTESSHRYTPEILGELAESAGFSPADEWTDVEWAFRESLWLVKD